MMNIPVPMAVSLAAAAVPSAAALIVAAKISRKRKKQKETAKVAAIRPPDGAAFSREVCQQVLEQQIDTIFNSFSALIEAECVKLKAIARSWAVVTPEEKSPVLPQTINSTDPVTVLSEPEVSPKCQLSSPTAEPADLGEQISACLKMGMSSAEIASKLNLSVIEVNLAMRLRGVDQEVGKHRGRLEAVA